MREAIGGTLLLYIVLIFLFIYIIFMGVVIHYGRVFRWKNTVVSYIEQYEGVTDDVVTLVERNVVAKGYNDGPICVCYNQAPNGNRYYNIKMYIRFAMPLVDKRLWPYIQITGQTSGIAKLKNGAAKDIIIKSCDEGYENISSKNGLKSDGC